MSFNAERTAEESGPKQNGVRSVQYQDGYLYIDNPSYPTRSLGYLRKFRKSGALDSPKQAKVKLRIVVVGAGIGGLSAAVALGRRGHSVIVLEREEKLSEARLLDTVLEHTRGFRIC